MLRLLVDTCIWLNLAKDHRQQPLLTALESMVKHNEVSLIVPRLVVDEFARNKEKIVRESGQSLITLLRPARQTIGQFGRADTKTATDWLEPVLKAPGSGGPPWPRKRSRPSAAC